MVSIKRSEAFHDMVGDKRLLVGASKQKKKTVAQPALMIVGNKQKRLAVHGLRTGHASRVMFGDKEDG
jgi:hypothetical protein